MQNTIFNIGRGKSIFSFIVLGFTDLTEDALLLTFRYHVEYTYNHRHWNKWFNLENWKNRFQCSCEIFSRVYKLIVTYSLIIFFWNNLGIFCRCLKEQSTFRTPSCLLSPANQALQGLSAQRVLVPLIASELRPYPSWRIVLIWNLSHMKFKLTLNRQ